MHRQSQHVLSNHITCSASVKELLNETTIDICNEIVPGLNEEEPAIVAQLTDVVAIRAALLSPSRPSGVLPADIQAAMLAPIALVLRMWGTGVRRAHMFVVPQLAIAKKTGRRLGMGTDMYTSSLLLGQHKDETIATLPNDELIEKADGFAGVFPEHKYEIVKRLQDKKHILGATEILMSSLLRVTPQTLRSFKSDATDGARSASDIVLTEPGLSVIISAVLTSRAIFQRMMKIIHVSEIWTFMLLSLRMLKIYAVSITIRIVLGFLLLALIWKFDFSPFMVLIIAILNDGTIMTISKDRS
ncbi:hypothetical protein R1sor_009369 [Riccia sorocarpa]|uniref:Uncharacterized protein n=1 Tax=Riccia sorocarpa TaxID=122646 RepID=A0ABD3HV13_9MARC